MALRTTDTIPDHWPVNSDWNEVLAATLTSSRFQDLAKFVVQQRRSKSIFPSRRDEFNAFRFCTFEQTRVVILGQDPYHGEGQAHGLSFSVPSGQKLPPSLKNIFRELKSDIGIDNDIVGDLTPWAKQGVLLLNTVLTVEQGRANSHRNRGWEAFTDHVISALGNRPEPLVFILWGKPAAKKREFVSPHHVILQSPHPSPLSAYRGFFGSRPFSRTNDALSQFGLTPIIWQLSAAAD